MVSVCMATYNGERYIVEQVRSILSQLAATDELIVSDDASTDRTLSLIDSFHDPRIKVFHNAQKGVANNFENALKQASGDYIFLSDQDDVWESDKIERMIRFMEEGSFDCVLCNCRLVDKDGHTIKSPHFDAQWPMRRPVWVNWANNAWLGCCMAFSRRVLRATLPFPKGLAAHDLWIALYAQCHFRCGYMEADVLVNYRRHDQTVSFTGGKSTNPLWYRVWYRLHLAFYLLRSFFVSTKETDKT